jgi:hypothetical protein
VLVDPGKDGSKDGGGSRCATLDDNGSIGDGENTVTDSGEVGVTTANGVVDTTVGTESTVAVDRLVVKSLVALVSWRVIGEVGLDDSLLVAGLRVDVGETTTGAEAVGSTLIVDGGVAGVWEEGGSNGGDVLSCD